MDAIEFARLIACNLSYVPNEQQAMVVAALAEFVCAPPDGTAERVFLLNGYAGTGKTSLTGALVKALRHIRRTSVLLAPTGRAAKVFAAYADHQAFTIHRKIYRHPTLSDHSSTVAAMQENKLHDAVFIVDEASMISGGDERTGTDLLRDLIHYVYTGDNCRLILLGDTAQLPPVGSSESPAMDAAVLGSFGLKVTRATLTRTSRQGARSGILYNATWLRKSMRLDPLPEPKIFAKGFTDVHVVPTEELIDALEAAYGQDGVRETILITRSNARAMQFNSGIRRHILYREEELCAGDLLLASKNNYFWASKVKRLPFIANGDSMTVNAVSGTEIKYGMIFADVRLCMTDRPDIEFDAKIMLDNLRTETAALTAAQTENLFARVINDPEKYSSDTPLQTRLRDLRTDPYYNALQMKFAYAVTCHKAQGGQWDNVFVDVGYIPQDAVGLDLYRWLYTSVSRARRNLYFIGPSEWMNS